MYTAQENEQSPPRAENDPIAAGDALADGPNDTDSVLSEELHPEALAKPPRPADEYHVWLASLLKAIRNPKVHSYLNGQIVYERE
ncbi:hypothetical protein E4U16_004634 [Claviceps sp. LM84 group G4]|nr:hypothetical protein E4U16_004634 [Claviceps sp. LM84 group G4]